MYSIQPPSWFCVVVSFVFYFVSIPTPEFRLIVHRHFLFRLFSPSRVVRWEGESGRKWEKVSRAEEKLPYTHIDTAKTRRFVASSRNFNKTNKQTQQLLQFGSANILIRKTRQISHMFWSIFWYFVRVPNRVQLVSSNRHPEKRAFFVFRFLFCYFA